MDAVKAGFLKKLFFGIAADPDCTTILEVSGMGCGAAAPPSAGPLWLQALPDTAGCRTSACASH